MLQHVAVLIVSSFGRKNTCVAECCSVMCMMLQHVADWYCSVLQDASPSHSNATTHTNTPTHSNATSTFHMFIGLFSHIHRSLFEYSHLHLFQSRDFFVRVMKNGERRARAPQFVAFLCACEFTNTNKFVWWKETYQHMKKSYQQVKRDLSTYEKRRIVFTCVCHNDVCVTVCVTSGV